MSCCHDNGFLYGKSRHFHDDPVCPDPDWKPVTLVVAGHDVVWQVLGSGGEVYVYHIMKYNIMSYPDITRYSTIYYAMYYTHHIIISYAVIYV